MGSLHKAIIPGLPDDLALRCLAKLSHGYHGLVETVSKTWRDLIRSSDYANYKTREGLCGNWLFVLTEGSNNEWVAYDPEADRWHPLSKIPSVHGKIYVAGGRNLACTRGLALAEVYDPVADKWEELPPMPHPQMDCLGLSYKGKFHVLSEQVGLPDQNTSEVFSLSDETWCTMEDVWPLSRAMQFAVQMIGYNRVYTVVDWGESLIKTRDSEKGEWYNIGSVPSVVLPDHSRQLEAFGYGFAALQNELYVIGGKALKWEQSGAGRFDIVKLDLVRVCNPLVEPLKWRETRPMIGSARGAVLGCASMEEVSSN
ncbi:F-box/kelch-repeat protein At1g16250 isoform X2 [Argentina anserina]|uniref:F-box/kelch-repeat protein At1g16250 isoform X2 n=1 Tax=Argentina anserina TaxID=57926 RepID=UPI00217688CC|nr:F-box/kelch-repeat protein At1g16250 isoform X2 [Potentilla anserina]